MTTGPLAEPVTKVLPTSLKANPLLANWLSIHADGTVSVRSGKVDLGQGISTALAQIVADCLQIEMARIRMVPASTAVSPNEGVTSGSLSVQDSGSALRLVAVQARNIYLTAAARLWGLAPSQRSELVVRDGHISNRIDGRHTSYWALADASLLHVSVAVEKSVELASEQTMAASAAKRYVGQSSTRPDIRRKVAGEPAFVHDMRLPGMVYGRVVHPPSSSAVLQSVDLDTVRSMPGVECVLQDGRFLGVIARGEYQALQAATRLAFSAQWEVPHALPAEQQLDDFLRSQLVETSLVGHKEAAHEPESQSDKLTEPPKQTHQLTACYSRPFLAHASIGPACAVAQFTAAHSSAGAGAALTVWSHTQGVFNLQADLALLMKMPAEAITVHHQEGAGCYGHNGADDVAADAALLARALPGRAVQVVWSREDELGCAPFGPAMAITVSATVREPPTAGGDAKVTDWQHAVWSNGHGLRPGRGTVPVVLAAQLVDPPHPPQLSVNAPLAAGGGAERNSVPLYEFGSWKATSHRLLTMPVRSSALRSLGAHGNVFAAESFIDELAAQVQTDPLAFRLAHLTDARARAVLQDAADRAGWQTRHITLAENHGLGLGVTRYKNKGAYCAVVARVDASQDLRVTDLWLSVDVGLIINPDGVANQMEGGAIQTVSWVLKEAVTFDSQRITSTTWDNYPILRFSEVPKVHIHLLDRPDQPSLGAGEATHGPVAAAIANALFAATGIRARHLPLTPERLRQAALDH